MAGHSLGEYTALCASGLLSFEDALRLTRTRGLLMEEACPAGAGGMVALMGPVRQKVEEVCNAVSKGDYVAARRTSTPRTSLSCRAISTP